MEQQFNRLHYATNRTFLLGQFVLAKDYRDGGEKWTAGRILRRTGRVTYDVEVQSSVWVRHANQLRPSFQPSYSIGCSSSSTYLKTFRLPLQIRRHISQAPAHPEDGRIVLEDKSCTCR
ncbi:hypothetical protein EG68_11657 [Paragonimus skrjabini miyazakii]|uniref:Uncharacterized protein n=1 Tax=Paragonimus skrjabini miyazakii TaxID=59628 RepID=A0A8S9YF95_9TREM|nr:hypothetical protein EG68_11657 [Paragonimus skrjabini miyazakii]